MNNYSRAIFYSFVILKNENLAKIKMSFCKMKIFMSGKIKNIILKNEKTAAKKIFGNRINLVAKNF